MEGEESGILETSPSAIALLIVFFLVVTLGIEHGLHHLKSVLHRRNKHGLLAAVTNLANELMLLGVASLLLQAVAPALTKICVPADTLVKPWLSNVQGCACCLQRTEGVTKCFLEDRQCPADWQQQCGAHAPHRPLSFVKHAKYATPSNSSTQASPNTASHAAPAQAAHAPAAEASPAGKRLLAAVPPAAEAPLPPVPEGLSADPATSESDHYEESTCAGPVEDSYEQCDYRRGYAPAVTEATLEQVHMLLFIMAVIHIILSVLVLLLSTFRLKLWAHANGGASDDALALAALQSPAAMKLQSAGAAAKGAAGGHPPGPAVVVVDDGNTTAPTPAGGLQVQNWKGRPEKLQHPLDWLREFGVSFVRQLFLGIIPSVSSQEYSLLRATFYHNHNIGVLASSAAHAPGKTQQNGSHTSPAEVEMNNLQPSSDTHTSQLDRQVSPADAITRQQLGQAVAKDPAAGKDSRCAAGSGGETPGVGLYGPYLLESAERFGSQVVGLGLAMWILLIVFVLLSGAIGWATWLLLILAGALMLTINTSLIAALRHVTRGGIVRSHSNKTWWLRHSKPLLQGIKLLLFFLSFVISNAIYFAGFFGPDSCFFSRTGFQRNPVSWYVVMLIDLGLLVSLALVTLPIYTLLMHSMRPDKALVLELAQRRQQPEGSHHGRASHDS